MHDPAPTRKLEGIFARGYGVVPKAVLLSPELSPEAKALYAYYCVMSGNGGGYQDSPAEAMILKTLCISHARFIRHRKTLIEGNYIHFAQGRKSIAQGKQLFQNTRYLIVKCPREVTVLGESFYANLPPCRPINMMAAVQEGIFRDGFGLVPRMVLFDRELSIEAKAAYVFLCVYANASTCGERTATPSASLLAERLMSRKRVQHAMNELTQAGYIRRERIHTGVYAGMCYILNFDKQEVQNDTAETFRQGGRNDTAEKSNLSYQERFDNLIFSLQETIAEQERQKAQNDITEPGSEPGQNETAEKDTAQIETATYKSTNTNDYQHTNISHVFQRHSGKQDGQTDAAQIRDEFAWQRENAETQIEADILAQEYGRDVVDAVVHVMADMYMARGGTVKINGRPYPVPGVAEMFKKLRFCHVEHVLDSIRSRGSPEVGNMQAYLIACLYNAPITYGAREYHDAAWR